MSDIDFDIGWQGFLLLLARGIAPFLIGFIAIGYLFFLTFVKIKVPITRSIIYSVVLGFVFGVYIGYTPIDKLYPITNTSTWQDYINLPLIVIIEILIIITHRKYLKIQKSKKNRK